MINNKIWQMPKALLLSILLITTAASVVVFYLEFLAPYILTDTAEYELDFGDTELRWGSGIFDSGIDSYPQIRVEYLLPDDFDPQNTPIVFYAPFGNAQKSLFRPVVYKFATEKKMLIFTMAFDYDIEKGLPSSQKRTDIRSGWHKKVFDARIYLLFPGFKPNAKDTLRKKSFSTSSRPIFSIRSSSV